MQDLTCYISFSDAQKRYEIKQAALSYRIKALRLKTKRKGRNTFLTVKHISLLDDLDKYLKENPGKTIDEFLSLQAPELQSITADLPIPQTLNSDSLLIDKSTIDESLIKPCITDESVMNPDLTQIKNQVNLILQAILRLEGTVEVTNESLINKPNYQANDDNDTEIAELEEEIEYLNQQLKKANDSCFKWQQSYNQLNSCKQIIEAQLIQKLNECEILKSFWKYVIPPNMNFQHLEKKNNRIYLVTNMVDFTDAKNTFLNGLSLVHR